MCFGPGQSNGTAGSFRLPTNTAVINSRNVRPQVPEVPATTQSPVAAPDTADVAIKNQQDSDLLLLRQRGRKSMFNGSGAGGVGALGSSALGGKW